MMNLKHTVTTWTKVQIVNDQAGFIFCKSMVAWEAYGNGETLNYRLKRR